MAVATCPFYFEKCFESTEHSNTFKPEIHYEAIGKECKGNKDSRQQNSVYWAFKKEILSMFEDVCRYI